MTVHKNKKYLWIKKYLKNTQLDFQNVLHKRMDNQNIANFEIIIQNQKLFN